MVYVYRFFIACLFKLFRPSCVGCKWSAIWVRLVQECSAGCRTEIWPVSRWTIAMPKDDLSRRPGNRPWRVLADFGRHVAIEHLIFLWNHRRFAGFACRSGLRSRSRRLCGKGLPSHQSCSGWWPGCSASKSHSDVAAKTSMPKVVIERLTALQEKQYDKSAANLRHGKVSEAEEVAKVPGLNNHRHSAERLWYHWFLSNNKTIPNR